jgi:hypothetical protein
MNSSVTVNLLECAEQFGWQFDCLAKSPLESFQMHLRFVCVATAMTFCLSAVSCSRPQEPKIKQKVPLTKVNGIVMVDGAGTGGVILRYKPQSDIAEKREMFVRGFTVRSAAKGKFALKTYESGDGVPAGEYRLYCEYFPAEGDDPRRTAPEDVLGGQYAEDKQPAKTFTVSEGAPLDLGTIELKTSPKK